MSHRIGKEYLALQKTLRDPAYRHVLELAPESDQDLSRWRARIAGPPDTPYAGHAFTLVIQIPSTYPMEPPQVRFEPRAMPHCNVDFDSGRICLNILEKAHWSPAWNVLHVVHAVWLLLSDPVPDSPLDVDLACLARAQDTAAMDGLVRYYLAGGSRGMSSST